MSNENAPRQIVEETDDQFRPTGVEFENNEQGALPLRPYDPEQIRVDPKTFSLRQILDMIDDGDLELAPDFQRLRVWKPFQKCRLIESVLLRIPLPAFYFSSDKDGGLQVVDGLQRLSTIHDFVRGGKNKSSFFPLEDLEYLQEQLGGKTFNQIDSPVWARRINNTQIVANVIDPQTPHRVKFDIFRRINTGGSPLNAQEIRHCLSGEKSRSFLKRLAESEEFEVSTGRVLRNDVRMVDREVVLRFCAFRYSPGLRNYASYDTMDEFLNAATEALDSASDQTLHQLETEFRFSMTNAFFLFREHSFRKWPEDTIRICPFNRALFDVWSVLLADYTEGQLAPVRELITTYARALMTNSFNFIASVTAGTSDPNKVKERFDTISDLLARSVK